MSDKFSSLERDLEAFLELVNPDHPQYAKAFSYGQQLKDSIAQARKQDSRKLEKERSDIVDQLNRLSLEILGKPFRKLSIDSTYVDESPAESTVPSNPSARPRRPTLLRLQLLQRHRGKMEVRVLKSPGGGDPSPEVRLPFTLHQLKAVLKALEQGEVNEHLKPEYIETLKALKLLHEGRLRADFHKKVGMRLYEALFPADVLVALGRSWNKSPVACQLCFDPEDVLLAQFPWELVHDGNMHLVPVTNGLELSRYITFRDPPPQTKLKLPLRLLVISPIVYEGDEAYAAEQGALLERLRPLKSQGLLDWEIADPPTWKELERRLDGGGFDMVHFNGHGSFARTCPTCKIEHYPGVKTCAKCKKSISDVEPQGYLYFQGSDRKRDPVSVDALKNMLVNREIQLVVLTACGSAVVEGVSIFNGVAPGLISAGIPAVVAMQSSPSGEAMAEFVANLYQSLAGGNRLLVAVNEGRQAIYRFQPAVWFMPVVYLRSADSTQGQLFRLK